MTYLVIFEQLQLIWVWFVSKVMQMSAIHCLLSSFQAKHLSPLSVLRFRRTITGSDNNKSLNEIFWAPIEADMTWPWLSPKGKWLKLTKTTWYKEFEVDLDLMVSLRLLEVIKRSPTSEDDSVLSFSNLSLNWDLEIMPGNSTMSLMSLFHDSDTSTFCVGDKTRTVTSAKKYLNIWVRCVKLNQSMRMCSELGYKKPKTIWYRVNEQLSQFLQKMAQKINLQFFLLDIVTKMKTKDNVVNE